MRRLALNLALLTGVLLLSLLVSEGLLRLTGFHWVLYPEQIEFGMPDPVLLETGFRSDDDLFWVTPHYDEQLTALREHPPSLIFQGDSCTQLGSYDQKLAEFVRRATGRTLESANLGVAGWSTHQGLAQLRRDVVPLAPRVVTIYYGWNDHWIGFGIEDRTIANIRRVFSSRWSHLRVVQLATKAWVAVKAGRSGYPNRVGIEDFADNLRHMIREARAAGIHPMLLTAPSNHRPGEEPEYLGSRWLRQVEDLVPLHQAYVAEVRRVAAEEDAPLCDLAARLGEIPFEARAPLFQRDGIHLSDLGDQAVAAQLFDCLSREGWIPLVTTPESDPSRP